MSLTGLDSVKVKSKQSRMGSPNLSTLSVELYVHTPMERQGSAERPLWKGGSRLPVAVGRSVSL